MVQDNSQEQEAFIANWHDRHLCGWMLDSCLYHLLHQACLSRCKPLDPGVPSLVAVLEFSLQSLHLIGFKRRFQIRLQAVVSIRRCLAINRFP